MYWRSGERIESYSIWGGNIIHEDDMEYKGWRLKRDMRKNEKNEKRNERYLGGMNEKQVGNEKEGWKIVNKLKNEKKSMEN
jgi:hypothetical protein